MIIQPNPLKMGRIVAEVDFDPNSVPESGIGDLQALGESITINPVGVDVISWSLQPGNYQFVCGWSVNGINGSTAEIGIGFTGSAIASVWQIAPLSPGGAVAIQAGRDVASFPVMFGLGTWSSTTVSNGQFHGTLRVATAGIFSIRGRGTTPSTPIAVLIGSYAKCERA